MLEEIPTLFADFFSVDGQLHCIDIDSTVLDSLDCNAVQEDCVTNTVTKCYMILVGHETVKTLTSFLFFSQCTKFHRLINCIRSIAKFYMKRVSSPLIVVQASICFPFFFFQSLLSSTKVYFFPFGRTLRKFKTRICCDLREVLTDMRPTFEQFSIVCQKEPIVTLAWEQALINGAARRAFYPPPGRLKTSWGEVCRSPVGSCRSRPHTFSRVPKRL